VARRVKFGERRLIHFLALVVGRLRSGELRARDAEDRIVGGCRRRDGIER